MGRAAASGAAYMGIAQAVRVLLTLLSTVIVARILVPEDFGVIAMVAPVTAFMLMFQNLGLSHAAIQARELTDAQSSSLFWLNVTASVALMVLLIAIAPAVAWFYDDPRAGYVTAASGASILVSGSAVQHLALLNRTLQFRRLGAIDAAGAGVSFVATVAAAILLRSYWALWLGIFLGAATTAVLAWLSCRWRPSRKISFRGSGALIRFGGAVTGFNLLSFFHRNLDNILIGRVWGPTWLGLYDRSYKLMLFPLQNLNAPLARVMLPVLSRLRDQPDRYRRSYLIAVRAVALLVLPAISVAIATSDRLVPFLLGPNWTEAAPIFFWLSLAALIQPFGRTAGWLFISSGRPQAMMRWAMFQVPIMIAAFSISVQWGPAAVAAAYFAVGLITAPLLFAYCVRGTPVSAMDLYGICLPAFVSVGLVWLLIRFVLPDWPMPALLSAALPLAYAVSISVHWLVPEGRSAIRTILSQLLSLRASASAQA